MSDTKLSSIGEAFCVIPLPATVCADLCATDASYPHPRYGTNLLSVAEAQQMLGPLVLALVEDAWRSGHATAEQALGAHGSERLLDAIEAGWAEYVADNALATTPRPQHIAGRRCVNDLDTDEARLDMVRCVLHAIVKQEADPVALAKAGLDFCDRTQAEREKMRGES